MIIKHAKEKYFEGVIKEVIDIGTGYYLEANLINAKKEKFIIQFPSHLSQQFEINKTVKVFFYDTTETWCIGLKKAKTLDKMVVPNYFKRYIKKSTTKKVKYISGIQGDLGKYLTILDNQKEVTLFCPFELDVDNPQKYVNQIIEILSADIPRKTFLRIEKK